ncbi:MAG: hypothetical protein HQM10_25405 [Candidatus Riflebacteria bacterium]|nr:hypothetical protein [Candidatus Riflebacteria bacterium]
MTVSSELFQNNPVLRGLGIFFTVVIFQMLFNTTWLLLLERPRMLILLFIAILAAISQFAIISSEAVLKKLKWNYPGVILWAHPLSMLVFAYSFFLILIVAVPKVYGRAFWSSALQLNAKCVTAFFSTVISAFSIYVLFSIIAATIVLIRKIIQKTLNNFEKMTAEDENSKSVTTHTIRLNRLAFYACFALLLSVGGWVIFFRPETILYMKAQIQLSSMIHPEIALEMFRQIKKKYPQYEYLDTIEYRCSWIIDRRMKKHDEAMIEYEKFIENYSSGNIWSEDVYINMIRIRLDKQKNFERALVLIEDYEKYFSNGHFAPHVELYKVRALKELNREDEASAVLAAAIEKFKKTSLILYDNEDDFVATLPFLSAARLL